MHFLQTGICRAPANYSSSWRGRNCELEIPASQYTYNVNKHISSSIWCKRVYAYASTKLRLVRGESLCSRLEGSNIQDFVSFYHMYSESVFTVSSNLALSNSSFHAFGHQLYAAGDEIPIGVRLSHNQFLLFHCFMRDKKVSSQRLEPQTTSRLT